MDDLRQFLRRLFTENGGEISFERFMQEALYHPAHGYYTHHIRGVGHRGDFSTSATLSPILGQAIARWIESEFETHPALKGGEKPWHIVEVGGGTGALAAAVLKAFPWWRRRRLRYHLVEISPPLRDLQKAELRHFKAPGIEWHDTIEEALEAAGGRAVIFSNELVDAFPVTLIQRGEQPADWDEVHVRYREETGISEVLRPLGPESRPEAFSAPAPSVFEYASTFSPGQRCDLHLSYRRWLEGWTPQWNAGSLLTIDYGARVESLYARRPRGTLRAYHHHLMETASRLYLRFGRQDLTADVNFTDLIRWGEHLGLETVRLETQREFLLRRVPRLRDLIERPDSRQTAFLLAEEGAGDAFQVLHQRAGL